VCATCCPPAPDPIPDTVACDTLDSHLDMINEAIEEEQCDDTTGQESDEVCHAITMKAIPPCMLMEGASEQAKCLAEAAEDIEEELGLSNEEAGTEVVANCKCDAFKKIRKALSSVRDMMCPPSDDRSGRTYSGFGANTLWFQYTLCQQESIPSLACWLFTSGWNQAEFGQYYLYENLLDSDNGAGLGLDGDLLPLLVLSGGLGGGAHSGPSYGGHPIYRREVIEDDGCPVDDMDCLSARKRRGATTTCHPDNVNCPARKRRGATTTTCYPDDMECLSARKRRGATTSTTCLPGDVNCPARKRRGTDCHPDDKDVLGNCPARKRRGSDCHPDDKDDEGNCPARKRRGTDCHPDDKDDMGNCVPVRKRRAACQKGEVEDGKGNCVSARKRRETDPCPVKDAATGKCVTARKRRATCLKGEKEDDEGNCVPDRKRRAACEKGEVEDKKGNCVSARKRRETDDCPVKDAATGECVTVRKRRETCKKGEVKDANGKCVAATARKRRGAVVCTSNQEEIDGECVDL